MTQGGPVNPADDGITVCLGLQDGVISRVEVKSRRLISLTSPLIGRPPDQAARLVAQLFSLCKVAQGLTSAQAFEAASNGLRPSFFQQIARRFLLLGETVLEHGGRVALDWPQLVGQPPCLTAVKALRSALGDLWRALYPAGDWMVPSGGALQVNRSDVSRRLALVIDAMASLDLPTREPRDLDQWQAWLGSALDKGNPAALLISAKWGEDPQVGLSALPLLPQGELESCLAADDGTFLTRPDWAGQVYETGPLARLQGHVLMQEMGQGRDFGFAARFAARLVELLAAVREMRDLAGALCDDPGLGAAVPPMDGAGLATVEAARGRLIHRVEVQKGVVTRYQILAPTEWNFHPKAALFQALVGQGAGDDPALLARLAAAALDPCVACSVEVN